MEQQPVLNEHNKKEYPPMHTAEHILNQTMIRLFGCERSKNTHIEKKKSKCDYNLVVEPTTKDIQNIEDQMNNIISMNLPVFTELVPRKDVSAEIDLSKLPGDASEVLRIVRIGNYDSCACIGKHVDNTAEIGRFKIVSTNFENTVFRIRFKLE